MSLQTRISILAVLYVLALSTGLSLGAEEFNNSSSTEASLPPTNVDLSKNESIISESTSTKFSSLTAEKPVCTCPLVPEENVNQEKPIAEQNKEVLKETKEQVEKLANDEPSSVDNEKEDVKVPSKCKTSKKDSKNKKKEKKLEKKNRKKRDVKGMARAKGSRKGSSKRGKGLNRGKGSQNREQVVASREQFAAAREGSN